MKYESPITYHSKDMANVKVFADRQMDRPKTIMPPIFQYGDIKINQNFIQATQLQTEEKTNSKCYT
jgi:hypothetical protein